MTVLTPRQQKNADRKAAAARIAEGHAKTIAIVRTGKCPLCGAGFRRNLSLTGWWQCEQYGDPGWRKNPDAPHCGWQGFTE